MPSHCTQSFSHEFLLTFSFSYIKDEVFLPKSDIDLENGELDEIEKEVEAFKR